jgi:hypothetical protein
MVWHVTTGEAMARTILLKIMLLTLSIIMVIMFHVSLNIQIIERMLAIFSTMWDTMRTVL